MFVFAPILHEPPKIEQLAINFILCLCCPFSLFFIVDKDVDYVFKNVFFQYFIEK